MKEQYRAFALDLHTVFQRGHAGSVLVALGIDQIPENIHRPEGATAGTGPAENILQRVQIETEVVAGAFQFHGIVVGKGEKVAVNIGIESESAVDPAVGIRADPVVPALQVLRNHIVITDHDPFDRMVHGHCIDSPRMRIEPALDPARRRVNETMFHQNFRRIINPDPGFVHVDGVFFARDKIRAEGVCAQIKTADPDPSEMVKIAISDRDLRTIFDIKRHGFTVAVDFDPVQQDVVQFFQGYHSFERFFRDIADPAGRRSGNEFERQRGDFDRPGYGETGISGAESARQGDSGNLRFDFIFRILFQHQQRAAPFPLIREPEKLQRLAPFVRSGFPVTDRAGSARRIDDRNRTVFKSRTAFQLYDRLFRQRAEFPLKISFYVSAFPAGEKAELQLVNRIGFQVFENGERRIIAGDRAFEIGAPDPLSGILFPVFRCPADHIRIHIDPDHAIVHSGRDLHMLSQIDRSESCQYDSGQ